MIKKRKIVAFILSFLMVFNFMAVLGFAEGEEEGPSIEITAEYAILIERNSGKVLYEKNADMRAYPASITKILTALVMIDYISMDEIVVSGNEVFKIPLDSSKAGHEAGESIIGENLLRGMIIPSGNETGCIIASAVAKKKTGNNDISYEEAEILFSALMNEKAEKIGAANSNFVNPHGYHDDNHYTTARDIALICREALKNENIFAIMGETEFTGNSAGSKKAPAMKTQDYNWRTTNLLITNGQYYYPNAKGIKTGFTTPAGYCLASYAEKDGKELIAVVLKDEQAERWADTEALFEYGFNTYNYYDIQEKGSVIENLKIYDPMLGAEDNMDVVAEDQFTGFFAEKEFNRIESHVTYKQEYIAVPKNKNEAENKSTDLPIQLKAPIKKDEVIGTIQYTLDGKIVYQGSILASMEANERTYKTDIKYYAGLFKENAFTMKALPGWAMIIAVIVLIVSFVRHLRRKRRKRDKYTLKRRY